MTNMDNPVSDISTKSFGKIPDLLIVIFIIILIPKVSEIIADLFYPMFQSVDPDETFIWISVHHITQLFLTVGLMLSLSRSNLRAWGFNLNHFGRSLKFIVAFFVIFGAMEYFRLSGATPVNHEYPLTAKNMIGVQGFQYFLSGLGEEPLFRGFVMVFLITSWGRIYTLGKFELPITVLIATTLFMLAHININFAAMTVSGFDIDQQMKALQLGLLYGVTFHYTKSLLAPIVMHGLSNGMMFTIGFYLV